MSLHDDVIKWKYFQRYRPFVRGIHRWPVNSPHKGQWRGALMFSLICAWRNGWVNNHESGNLRHHLAHYDVIVMLVLLWCALVLVDFTHTLEKHDDVIKWKHFLPYWPLALCEWIPLTKACNADLWFLTFFDVRLSKWLSKSRDVGDLRRHGAHYDVIVMK